MHWLSPVFYKEAKFGPLEKKKKKGKKLLTSMEMKIFRRTECYTLFDHKSNE